MKEVKFGNSSYQIYEKEFLTELEKWIDQKAALEDTECWYLFDSHLSRQELIEHTPADHKESIRQSITQQLTKYHQVEESTNYRFRFIPVDKPVSGPFIIGDNRYGIWIMGADNAISFSQENEKIATPLVRTIKSQFQKSYSLPELIEIFDF